MTANELANWIEDENVVDIMFTPQEHYRGLVAAMLRKQANRIEVLEANHKIQVNINEKALQYIDHLEQGLRASIDLNKAQAERNEK